ncbi:hypothetical protein B0T21DRAFT_298997 [Apiosordaria backusii]|uniref:HD domain-containing protein n=1 Tax=Apiosordaria backusii TaxID=314023 RepID=A0AA39ZYB4_9PEZI|nr:hypothetical protein B0T21DRAFT_298997 [Apiosordaria backusii]
MASLPTIAIAKLPFDHPYSSPSLSRRTLGGVSVIDTPIVRAAQAFVRTHSSDKLYNHVMRSWLFGTLLLDHNATLRALVDEEVHAIGLMLHDLGANHSLDSPFVTLDRRFEVDGAFAARDFIRSHPDGAKWDERRVQLVWDAIALHAEPKFALYKEPDVVAIYWGNDLDFSWEKGPRHGVTREEYDGVLREFPKPQGGNAGQGKMVLEGITWYCRHKPLSTYDTFMQPYGELFVPGYSAVGHRGIDRVLASVGLNASQAHNKK